MFILLLFITNHRGVSGTKREKLRIKKQVSLQKQNIRANQWNSTNTISLVQLNNHENTTNIPKIIANWFHETKAPFYTEKFQRYTSKP